MVTTRRLPAVLLASVAFTAIPAASVAQAGLLPGPLGQILPLPSAPTQLPATPAELAPLGGLLGSLAGGAAPTATDLAALTTLLGSLQGEPGVEAILAQLHGGASLMELPALGDLLQSLAATPGVPAPLAALLNPIAATLGGEVLTGLPSATSLAPLLALVQGGGVPTGGDLSSVLALLDAVKAQLPAGEAGAIDALLGSLGPNPSPAALAPLGQLLQLLAGAPGVPAPLSATLTQLGVSLGAIPKPAAASAGAAPAAAQPVLAPSGSFAPVARAAAPGPKAAVKAVKVDKGRTRLTVSVKCPAGRGACTSIVYALRGGKLVSAAQTIAIPAGKTVTRSFKLNAAARKAVEVRGYRVTVGALSTGGLTQKGFSVKRVAKRR